MSVTDINDNTPQLGETVKDLYVFEGQSNSPVSGRIWGNDEDDGANGEVRYKIENNDFFRIDENSGNLFTKRALDFETQRTYEVPIILFDRGTPSRSSVAYVTVHVQDVDDEIPKFEKERYEASVNENEEDAFVIKVTVIMDGFFQPNIIIN